MQVMEILVNNWKIWVKDWEHSACFEQGREEPQDSQNVQEVRNSRGENSDSGQNDQF